MGHRTNERRYVGTRLLVCPDCGAIWAVHNSGGSLISILWRDAPCCPLCRDGPEMGRRRIEQRQAAKLLLTLLSKETLRQGQCGPSNEQIRKAFKNAKPPTKQGGGWRKS